MNIAQFNSKMTSAMKTYIKTSRHIETGKLLTSIKFNSTDTNGLDIKFIAEPYIEYLDDGKFIQNFFDLATTMNIIETYITSQVEQTLGEL